MICRNIQRNNIIGGIKLFREIDLIYKTIDNSYNEWKLLKTMRTSGSKLKMMQQVIMPHKQLQQITTRQTTSDDV